MFFPPIGVKRVRLEETGQAYRMMTTGGAAARTLRLDDWGRCGYAINSLISHDISQKLDISLRISELFAMISSKEN